MSTPTKMASPVAADRTVTPTDTTPTAVGLSSATSPPGHAASSPTTAPVAAAPHSNPKVAELQTMFPTVEVTVIELVLETCGGSTDRSIEQLLSMTDENFKPDELESVRREEAVSWRVHSLTDQ